ncbi:hypothetical protein U1Q18_038710 [Sarracenia purpurea var. burkii]
MTTAGGEEIFPSIELCNLISSPNYNTTLVLSSNLFPSLRPSSTATPPSHRRRSSLLRWPSLRRTRTGQPPCRTRPRGSPLGLLPPLSRHRLPEELDIAQLLEIHVPVVGFFIGV